MHATFEKQHVRTTSALGKREEKKEATVTRLSAEESGAARKKYSAAGAVTAERRVGGN